MTFHRSVSIPLPVWREVERLVGEHPELYQSSREFVLAGVRSEIIRAREVPKREGP